MAGSNMDVCDRSDLILRCGRYPFDGKVLRWLLSLLPRRLLRKCLRDANNYLYLKHEYRVRFLLEHLAMFEELQTRLSALSLSEARKRRALDLLLQTGGRYQMALESPDTAAVFLLEEGFAHRAVSLFVSPDEEEVDSADIEAYLRTAPRCEAVIRVEADCATCVKRLQGRRLPKRLVGSSTRDIEIFVSRARDTIDVATKELVRIGVPVFTLHNSEEPFPNSNIKSQLDGLVEKLGQKRACENRHDATHECLSGATSTSRDTILRNS